MALNQNQFAITPVPGDISNRGSGVVVNAQIKIGEIAPILPGQAVKIVDVASQLPVVTALTGQNDVPMGVITRNLKNAAYTEGNIVELALMNTIVYMTASEAISWLQPVHYNYSTDKVEVLDGSYPQVGLAYDKATADGDVIRVLVTVPTDFVDQGHLTA